MLGVGRRDPTDQRSVLARSDPPLRHPRHRRDLGRVPAGTAGPGARRRGTGGHAASGWPSACPGCSTARRSRSSVTWIPELGLDLDLRLDGFAALMVLIVAGIGVLVFAYAARYLPRRGRRRRAAGRPAHAVRRRHGRPRPGRQPAPALHVLGAHVGHVVPPHRQRPRRRPGPGRRPAGPARHQRRRPGHARRLRAPRAGRRHLPAQRDRRRRRRSGTAVTVALVLVLLGAFDQVGPVPVPLLAAGRHGGADAGQRLPPLGHHGEGRRLPRRPASSPAFAADGALAADRSSPSAWSRWSPAGCGRSASTT